ncbi:beta-lactamase family protein [Candidatus Gracilibacteria bacterium]|nr:beta-lactamase family protein [Candidatus Gracilibacteria bacterium]
MQPNESHGATSRPVGHSGNTSRRPHYVWIWLVVCALILTPLAAPNHGQQAFGADRQAGPSEATLAQVEPDDTTTDPMIIPEPVADLPPARTSVRTNPVFGSLQPPGYAERLYLPLIRTGGAAPTVAQAAQDTHPAPAQRDDPRRGSCPAAPPWVSQHGMSESFYAEENTWAEAGFRPISVSTNGSGAAARFSVLWIRDGAYPNAWRLRHAMPEALYQQRLVDYATEGYRPIAVDVYGTEANPLYIAIWVRDDVPFTAFVNESEADTGTIIDENWEQGYRMLWITGHSGGAVASYSGIFVQDGVPDAVQYGMSADGLNDIVGPELTAQNYRMIRLSTYEVAGQVRYAGVWVRDPAACGSVRWEAFPAHTSTEYQIKASAQINVGDEKPVANNAITLNESDLGTYFRLARIQVDPGASGAQLRRITEAQPEQVAQHGDILVLQVPYAASLLVVDHAQGNIRLRSWDSDDPGLQGQSFAMNNYQNRLVLQYDSSAQEWYELQRNSISPDYYFPISLDEVGPPDNRRYASVWLAGPSGREWRVNSAAPIPADDPLERFDAAMRVYMQDRNATGGALAIAVDGRLVLARGYNWEIPEAAAVGPESTFRLASVSKPITAVAIMQLVQDGSLDLDQTIVSIPGVAAAIGANAWQDPRINNVTVRHLLQHLGGWDRGITPDPMVHADFTICDTVSLTLPTTLAAITEYTSGLDLDHAPGEVYAYSNFGYALLGLIIEQVSGMSYANYVQTEVLNPLGVTNTLLTGNTEAERHPGEVWYYQPTNGMPASRLGFTDPNPDRELCTAGHADRLLNPYGGLNLVPMAAHGGWASSAVDMARFLVAMEQNSLINSASRSIMWERPAGRAVRVLRFTTGSNSFVNFTRDARESTVFTPIIATDTQLLVGRGLVPFSGIEFDLAQAGQGYSLRVAYSTKLGFQELTVDAHGLDDGTANFDPEDISEPATIRFTPPADWEPITLSEDAYPRYWIRITTDSAPTVPVQIQTITPVGGREADYGHGWGVSHSNSTVYTLAYRGQNIPNGVTVQGVLSHATGRVVGVSHNSANNQGILQVDTLRGGSFWPEERLIATGTAAPFAFGNANDRERPRNASTSHGGLLWGSVTEIQHRTDNIHWVVLLNFNNDGRFYIKDDGIGQLAINDLINEIEGSATLNWPNHDLFP